MQSACLKIPWKLEGNDLKLSITKVFSLKALCKSFHNALSIMGRASRLLRENGMGDKVAAFQAECMSGDYNHLLATCMEWFDCD